MSSTARTPSADVAPSKRTAQQLVAFRFADESTASAFAEDIATMHRRGNARLHDAVFVTKDEHGDTTVIDRVAQMPAGRGALEGGVWGVLVGIMVGGPVAGLAVGAGLGALHARLPDRGINRDFIADIADSVRADSVVLILLVSHTDNELAVALLERYPGIELAGSELPLAAEQFLRSLLDVPAHPSNGMTRPLVDSAASASPSGLEGT